MRCEGGWLEVRGQGVGMWFREQGLNRWGFSRGMKEKEEERDCLLALHLLPLLVTS